MPRLLLHALLLTSILAGTPLWLEGGQPTKGDAPLSVEDVVKMVQAGFSEELIITRIKKNGKAFDLSTEELLELKKAGLSDNIIKYLLDPSQPYTPAPPPPANPPDPSAAPPSKPSAPAKQYPADIHASGVPEEPGLYHLSGNAPLKIDIKMLLGAKEGAGLGKVLMKKGKVIAYLVGAASKTRIKESAPIFYMRLLEGKGIEEVILVALERKSDRREMEMGPPGPKPELKAEAMRQFDSLEVGPRLFKINAGTLAKGEYLFFLIGSAEPPKGSYGKGYDFGIDAPPR